MQSNFVYCASACMVSRFYMDVLHIEIDHLYNTFYCISTPTTR